MIHNMFGVIVTDLALNLNNSVNVYASTLPLEHCAETQHTTLSKEILPNRSESGSSIILVLAFNPIGNVKGVQWTTHLTKYQPSIYLATQHFSFTTLSAALQQQWCVYSIYMPVCESSSGKTFLYFDAWKFRSYTGPYSEDENGGLLWGLEKQGPKNKSAAPRWRRQYVFFSTIIEHRKYGVILQQAGIPKRLIVVECQITSLTLRNCSACLIKCWGGGSGR